MRRVFCYPIIRGSLPGCRRHFSPQDFTSMLSSPSGMMMLMGRNSTSGGAAGGEHSDGEKGKAKEEGVVSTPVQRPWYQNDTIIMAIAIMAVAAIWDWAKQKQSRVKQWFAETFYVSLELRTYQQEYDMVIEWLSHQDIGRNTRNMMIKTHRHDFFDETTDEGDNREKFSDNSWLEGSDAFVPGYGMHRVKFRGHTLWIERDIDDATSKKSSYNESFNAAVPDEVLSITTFARDRTIIDEFMREVRQSTLEARSRFVPIHTTRRYGGWSKLCFKAKRPLDTIHVTKEAEGAVDEIRRFLKLDDEYRRVGVPWRRGYLLDGPPGTGKSSFILGVAGELNLPIYILSLRGSGVNNDNDLITSMNTVPKKSIVVLEDLDAAIPRKQWDYARTGRRFQAVGDGEAGGADGDGHDDGEAADDGSNGVTVSGLLNAMDGIASTEGRITFVTANHPEVFPESLVRPGRIDKRLHFGHMGSRELEAMFQKFSTGRDPAALLHDVTGETQFDSPLLASRSPAYWQNLLVSHCLLRE